ncbi:MAG: ATP-binding protein [Rugosibacter sp.]|nr:ATP-binding protein [Rugosibacter sp.]
MINRYLATEVNQTPASFWRSLLFFSVYRLSLALFFLGVVVIFDDAVSLGAQNARLFRDVASIYLLLSVVFLVMQIRHVRHFDMQLTLHVVTDILVLTLMMFASGGQKSGIATLLLVVVSGAGLVGQGRMVLFYAALASVAVLLEEGWWALVMDSEPADFFSAGITCLAFFAAAIAARLLAKRVVTNELLALERGQQLDAQLRVSEQIIRDMEGGVLVINSEGQVHMSNPQARILLDMSLQDNSQPLSGLLAERFWVWQEHQIELTETLFFRETNRQLRVRYLPPSSTLGDSLLYLEDMAQVNFQSQQIKLAALGRLTTNLAHEIRNPLAAISHAAELLAEDDTDFVRQRLACIVHDNTLRLNRLVTEVLEVGRRDRISPELIDWTRFIHGFMEEIFLHDASAASRIRVMEADGLKVWFDRGHLHRVLWNLLVNALRYASDAEGAIRVHAKIIRASSMELHISDDGSGIEEHLRAQVLEPFFTTHGAGTGLGLYIARELCEANKARLELLSNAPGAHFRITLEGELCL